MSCDAEFMCVVVAEVMFRVMQNLRVVVGGVMCCVIQNLRVLLLVR